MKRAEKKQLLSKYLAEAENQIRALPVERLMDGFKSNAAFADFLAECRRGLDSGRSWWSERWRLRLACMPTGDWDDCVEDVELGEAIYQTTQDLYTSFP